MATTLQQQIEALEAKTVRVEQELQEAAENEKAVLQQRLAALEQTRAALEQKSLLLMQQQAGAAGWHTAARELTSKCSWAACQACTNPSRAYLHVPCHNRDGPARLSA
jgi:ABC-type hemin transport system substrate-binding protein